MTVYVAYNHDTYTGWSSTPNRGPNWLTQLPPNGLGFDFSYERISVRYNSGKPYYWDVWERFVPKGETLILGGNNATGAQFSGYYDPYMYFVLVKIHEDSGGAGATYVEPTEISYIPPFLVQPPNPRVMIAYDNSGSMEDDMDGDSHNRMRKHVGRDAITRIINRINDVQLGLATYDGHSCSFNRPYPGNFAGCSQPSGRSMVRYPAAYDKLGAQWLPAEDLSCLTNDPCTANYTRKVTTAAILQHFTDLDDDSRRNIKYGSYSGNWNNRDWPSLPPFANRYLQDNAFFGDEGFQSTSCYYHNMQGTEGILRNAYNNGTMYTPVAGTLWGIRDYLLDTYIPEELGTGLTEAQKEISPFYNSGCHCTSYSVILITDGDETCNASSAMATAAGNLHDVLVDNYGTEFPDDNYNKVKTYVIALGSVGASKFTTLAQNGGTDAPYAATNDAELEQALLSILQQVSDQQASGGAVAVEASTASGGDYIYRALYVPKGWYGDLEAFGLSDDGELLEGCTDPGCYPDYPLWSYATWLRNNWSTRPVYTYTGSVVSVPLTDFITNSDVQALYTGDQINYFRGDPSNEVRNSGTYRDRETTDEPPLSNPLGDIIHSSPIFVGAPPFNYQFNDYQTYKQDNQNRPKTIYVGANDGFLHAINSETGAGRWVYCPSHVIPKLGELLNPSYLHKYFVDGAPSAADIYTQGAWRTILVIPLRGGGKAIHMLDVTDPLNPEFYYHLDGDGNAFEMLGFSVDNVKIVRKGDASNPKWYMFVASGLENDDNTGWILGIDLETRSIESKIRLCESAQKNQPCPSGQDGHYITDFSIADTNSDGNADTIYAGDLKGFLWKIDISDPNPAQWDIPYKSGNTYEPLCRAVDVNGQPQPITTGPEVSISCNDVVVFFGTGKFYHVDDRTDLQRQSFYAILDHGDTIRDFDRSAMTEIVVTKNAGEIQLDNFFTFEAGPGQYLDFLDLPEHEGERVIIDPIVMHGMIYFVTAIPNDDVCGTGGTSVIYGVPFYSTCQDRQQQPDLSEDIDIEEHGSIIIGAKHVWPGNLYFTDNEGDIKRREKTGVSAVLQPRSWKEILE
jgi:hypothetical protein